MWDQFLRFYPDIVPESVLFSDPWEAIHELSLCWFNIRPPSVTLTQHYTDKDSLSEQTQDFEPMLV